MFCWVTITVKDMEDSLRFYQEIVGLKVNRRFKPMPTTEISFLGSEGTNTEVELIKNDKIVNLKHGKDISMGFIVKSLEETIAKLKSKKVENIEGPFLPGPNVKFIYITDPNGVKIQFVENNLK